MTDLRYQKEKKLYELLGVKLFKRIILKSEEFRHLKDNSYNINYHIKDIAVSSINMFYGYILYNATWHIISVILITICYILYRAINAQYVVFDILIILLLLFNAYCIMLQRYIYIKLQSNVEKRKRTRAKQQAEAVNRISLAKAYRSRTFEKEKLLISRLRNVVQNGGDYLLTEEDSHIIYRLAEVYNYGINKDKKTKKRVSGSVSLEKLIMEIPDVPLLERKASLRTSKLQNLIHTEKSRNVLFDFCFITGSAECEEAYRALFSDGSRDDILFVLEVLYQVYSGAYS